jgi:N-acetylglutamate synthase-like GNAT family acetyltransferase
MLELRSPEGDYEWSGYFGLRHEVLRKPLGLPAGSERDDREEESVHVAVFDGAEIVGTGRLQVTDPELGRIRYLAVVPRLQKRGIGGMMLQYLERAAVDAGLPRVFLASRDTAVAFYLKHGYVRRDEPFEYKGIVHQWLEKQLAHED